MPTDTAEASEFETWARAEVERAGLLDEDSAYDGMLGESVLQLVDTFAAQGHSGQSAALTADVFVRLVERRPLLPLTNHPDEWQKIDEAMAGNDSTWQSRRMPGAFSNDGGMTYYDLDERQSRWRRFLLRHTSGWRWAKHHTSVKHPKDPTQA